MERKPARCLVIFAIYRRVPPIPRWVPVYGVVVVISGWVEPRVELLFSASFSSSKYITKLSKILMIVYMTSSTSSLPRNAECSAPQREYMLLAKFPSTKLERDAITEMNTNTRIFGGRTCMRLIDCLWPRECDSYQDSY
ncbi:hypothetical protein ACJIZ3_024487 [Penstemon smallii]|uniref:Uncharacterized protein n=1 Tax=Penstemon smallii TaxID=265156 RepID=A0ABD3TTL9_9LAMI